MATDEQAATPVQAVFGEPFDSGLARAELRQRNADPAAAQAEYQRLLSAAEALHDSPGARLLRAHLLANSAVLRLSYSEPAEAAAGMEQAFALLRDEEDQFASAGPFGRGLWLDNLLKLLLGRAELLRRAGSLNDAQECLDEAAARLAEFEGDGTRAAELGHHRVLLLIARGEWGAAEELAAAVVSTTPAGVATVPRLLTSLGLICASTGRFDLAEDYFTRAGDSFRASGELGEAQRMPVHCAYSAMRSGDLDRAERLYAEASASFERQRRFGDLAVCEQARGFLASVRGDDPAADSLMATSLARFERLGASLAAADTTLLAAQQAHGRGDLAEMQGLAQDAREVYAAQQVYERCAQTDLLVAAGIEAMLNRPGFGTGEGDRKRPAIDSALALALPAALALEAARHDFVTGHARSQWFELTQEAMRMAFRLAVARQDQGLLFELVEHRCAGTSLALDRTPPAPRPGRPETPALFPEAAMKVHRSGEDRTASAAGGGDDAMSGAGLRVALPPRVRMSSGSDRTALQEYVAEAESRYQRRVVSEQGVHSWTDDPATRSRPVVQIRLADAGDLFMAWRWVSGAQGFGTGHGPAAEVDHAVKALAEALPGPGDGMRRAFDSGAMAADYPTERRLSLLLAQALWPPELTAQLRQVSAALGRPLIRIQPSPRTAQVPWELLVVDTDDDVRLIEVADVVTTAPAALRRARPAGSEPTPSTSGTAPVGGVVLVLDPRVPGFRAESALGAVLGRPGADPELLSLVRRHLAAGSAVPSVDDAAEAFRRTDLDRDWLGDALRAGARRLLYVGHVSGAPVGGGQSEDAALHLCCGPQTLGLAEVVRSSHRPLSAKDLLLGTRTLRADGVSGDQVWPAPPRVALIACESGGDLRFAESFGLASAMLHNGAELVTATRWTLPTSFAFHHLAGLPENLRPLSEAVVAVDAAQDHPDPPHALGRWQRDQLTRWRTDGRIEHSPLLWAAITTITL
jgi:tetratricopeptide (TPR) repeat protein